MWQGAKRDLLTVPETFARHVKVGFNCQLTGTAEVGPWCHCRSEDEPSVTGQRLRTAPAWFDQLCRDSRLSVCWLAHNPTKILSDRPFFSTSLISACP